MTERDALLAAVLAAPDDDLCRLVFADWLDENGEHDRAYRIRFMCAHPRKWFRILCDLEHGVRSGLDLYTDQWVEADDDWSLGPAGANWRGIYWHRGFVAGVRYPLAAWVGGEECRRCEGRGKLRAAGVSSRFSPECLACSGTGRFSPLGPRLVREHPLTRVVLTDKEPNEFSERYASTSGFSHGRFMWQSFGPEENRAVRYRLPREIIDILYLQSDPTERWRSDTENQINVFFPARDAALDALSAALLAWAKSQPVPVGVTP